MRNVLAIVGGTVAGLGALALLARLLYEAWPGYASGAQAYGASGTYNFSPAMWACNAVFWIIAEIAAGYGTAWFAARREPASMLALMVMTYMCFMHLYREWSSFPWWYNLAVALPSGAAVWLGARLYKANPQADMSLS